MRFCQGCCSSHESDASPANYGRPSSSSPPNRATAVTAITSETAINPPLSTTTSRRQRRASRLADQEVSHSNVSSPRTSTQRGHQDVSLDEHYNAPLVAPKPWKSKDRSWTRPQLDQEREEFFETRVTGRKEVWDALKQISVCIRDGDLADAQGMLDAAAITLPTGRLEDGAYDERGVLYKLPEAILSDPTNVAVDDDGETFVGADDPGTKLEDKEMSAEALLASDELSNEKGDKGKEAIEKDAVKIKCRLSDRGGPDATVLMGQSQPVSTLVRRLKNEVTVSSSAEVKIAYLGHILDEKQSLEEQGWQQGHVIQALVVGAPP